MLDHKDVPAVANIFLISDTHFGHENIYRIPFYRADGTRMRPFLTSAEADEQMIANWNATVRAKDHVYHLGDVALGIPSTHMAATLSRLNGIKRLVRGNHDRYQTSQYIKAGFKEIHGMRLLHDVWLTHAPIHPWSLGRALGNAHGHIHANESPPGVYANLCVELNDYTPVSLDTVRDRLKQLPRVTYNTVNPSPDLDRDPCPM